ncbi:Transmembrane protein 44 [Chelonia mydas]|uniref:Transmembrane protein 44 n=1 Tax=Chelonia mydas TaxID=8469 RepID=M7AIK9_CHEMY|nr:Transmembrane protein 44 [Chelonia mydas]
MAASSSPEEFHGAQRRLLGTVLQENTEVLGFALGMLAALIAFTARIPALSGACRGRLSPATQLWASVSSALASVLYAAAIVTYDQRPPNFVRAGAWLPLPLGPAALAVAVSFPRRLHGLARFKPASPSLRFLFFSQWDFEDMNLQWNRNSTEAPTIQPSRSSLLNAGFGFDVNALKQTAAALRLCDNDGPWAEKS